MSRQQNYKQDVWVTLRLRWKYILLAVEYNHSSVYAAIVSICVWDLYLTSPHVCWLFESRVVFLGDAFRLVPLVLPTKIKRSKFLCSTNSLDKWVREKLGGGSVSLMYVGVRRGDGSPSGTHQPKKHTMPERFSKKKNKATTWNQLSCRLLVHYPCCFKVRGQPYSICQTITSSVTSICLQSRILYHRFWKTFCKLSTVKIKTYRKMREFCSLFGFPRKCIFRSHIKQICRLSLWSVSAGRWLQDEIQQQDSELRSGWPRVFGRSMPPDPKGPCASSRGQAWKKSELWRCIWRSRFGFRQARGSQGRLWVKVYGQGQAGDALDRRRETQKV